MASSPDQQQVGRKAIPVSPPVSPQPRIALAAGPLEYEQPIKKPEQVHATERDYTHEEALRIYGLSAAELVELDRGRRPQDGTENKPNDHDHSPTGQSGPLSPMSPSKETSELYRDHLVHEYDGGSGRGWSYKYVKPARTIDPEAVSMYMGGSVTDEKQGKRPFLNPVGKVIWKFEDVDAYLSPADGVPRRLVIQATDTSQREDESSWRRTKIRGNVPLAFRLAEWSLSPNANIASSIIRQALVAMPLQILLAMPGLNAPWEMRAAEPTYMRHPAYHWKWPKHAKNPLDERSDRKHFEKPVNLSSKRRLYRPRRLVVRGKNGWKVEENPDKNLAYIFLSYHWDSFSNRPERIDEMAQYMCQRAGVRAYFQDSRCNASTDDRDLLTADVNRMCDAIRGSRCVAILLPDTRTGRKRNWGRRMWTLPEGLLAPGKLEVCTWLASERYDVQSMSKIELTSEFWEEAFEDSDELSGRVLAEHYDGVTHLSRLELFTSAVAALAARVTANDYTGADLAYALMGLLRYRVEPDPTDDLFQVIARLSLANDSDRLIERLISLFPKALDNRHQFIRSFAEKDEFDTYCWDIEPRCQVVGVADEPDSVVLSDCRAVPIEWRCFPRMMYKRPQNGRSRFASFVVRSGAWWLGAAVFLAASYAALFYALHQIVDEANDIFDDIAEVKDESIPSDYQKDLWLAIVIFAGISVVLSVFAPLAVHQLFGGPALQTVPHLVAFEGVMPRTQLEGIVFGNDRGRLRYDPSSTPFSRWFRHSYIRRGLEPDWFLAGKLPESRPGHRWFTLVDTGNLTISIFEARRPPTVAFITGGDGGMLRAVLCSWRFANDCHYRETVIRVPSDTWKRCDSTAWVKVCLYSQDDLFHISNRPRTWPANAVPSPT